MPSVSSPNIPVHSRNRANSSWSCAGPILVTGGPAGFLLLTTRPTREDKYLLRALEVRVATWVLLIGERKMVSPDQINLEPPESVAGELRPM